MAPMNWLFLYFLFTLTFLIFNFINYYTYMIKTSNNNTKINFNKKTMNWKW